MCDENDLERWSSGTPTRRQFGAMGALGALSACAPAASGGGAPASSAPATGSSVASETVRFATADGTLDGEFFHRPDTTKPGVIFWPDIAGIRPANRQMAQRLAEAGYAVLLANPYYRDVHGQQFADFADFAGGGGFQKVEPWRAKFNADSVMRDTRAAVAWLDGQSAVDTARKLGAQGYCMTGGFALWAAGAAPDRIGAAASFHGGGLVQPDNPKGPRAMFAANSSARYLLCIAQNDDAKAPDDKTALRRAAEAAKAEATIEVYPADHGWTVPDSPSYDQTQAERAWEALKTVYSAAL